MGIQEDSARKWQRILMAVQRAATTAAKSKRQRAELPADVLDDLAHGLELALRGFPPPALGERHPEDKRPRELHQPTIQDVAAAHVLAVRAGLIDDPTPIKTVRELCRSPWRAHTGKGVDDQTVRNWVNQELANPGHESETLARVQANIAHNTLKNPKFRPNSEFLRRMFDIRVRLAPNIVAAKT